MGMVVRRGNGHVEAAAGAVTLTTRAEDMAAYDALPAPIRAAIAEAPVNWSAANILDRWRRASMVYGERRATAAAIRVLREAVPPEPGGPVVGPVRSATEPPRRG